jgi:hypothetical protein
MAYHRRKEFSRNRNSLKNESTSMAKYNVMARKSAKMRRESCKWRQLGCANGESEENERKPQWAK